jgi:tRNA(fMet)-specific endonuclease VapC
MYLIDTDVLVYSLNGDATVISNFVRTATEPKAISVISYGELFLGALRSARVAQNLARVRRLAEIYPVIEVSRGIMETFAQLKAPLQRQGKTLDDFDLLIAATAMALGYRLVTNNDRHFRRVSGLELENWARSRG